MGREINIPDNDVNWKAYKELRKSEEWVSTHLNHVIAFACGHIEYDGLMQGFQTDVIDVIRLSYSGAAVLVVLVTKEDPEACLHNGHIKYVPAD